MAEEYVLSKKKSNFAKQNHKIMRLNKNLYLASLLLLCSCGNGNQNQGNEPSAKENAIDSTAENTKETPNLVQPETAFISFYKNANPFHVVDTEENIDATIEHFKKFTHAYLFSEGKFVEVKFKEFQKGENNAGAFVADNYRDEWTGFVYESKYKNEAAGLLFNDEYVNGHRPAKVVSQESPKLSASESEFVKAHYPNLKIKRVCQSVNLEDGDAKIFSVQFEPSGEKTLALNVFEKGDKYYINEEWGNGDQYSTWNVDDEGEYHYPDFTIMVANDRSSYDLFFTRGAIESFAVGKYEFKQDSIIPATYACYYQTVDYQSKRVPDKWVLKYQWKSCFDGDDNCMPKEYALTDLNNDGIKELICRDKASNRIAVFKFENGSIEPYDCNYSSESKRAISLKIYQNGVATTYTAAEDLSTTTTTITPFTSLIINHYRETQKMKTTIHEKVTYGKATQTGKDLDEYEAEKAKLGKEITNYESFDWKKIQE